MYKQKAQQELQRVCTKAVPDCLPSTTSIAEKRKCHHFHNYYVLDLYDRLIGQASVSFANLVQTGEHIEDNHKTEKIEDYQTPFDQSFGGTSDSRNKNLASRQNDRNETEVHTISAPVSQYQHPYASPAPIYQLIAPPPPPPTYHMVYPPPPPLPPPPSLFITISNNTRRTVPTTISNITTNKEILNATRVRLLETSLLYPSQCLNYIRSFGMLTSLPQSNQNL